MINPGQHVKILLCNNSLIEGFVEQWGKEIQLKSLDGESLLIIHHPDRDIVLTKVVLVETKKPVSIKELVEQKTELQQNFEEVYQQPSGDNLRVKKLAELKIELAKQEKKIIAEKMKDHTISQVKKVNYELPGFLKK